MIRAAVKSDCALLAELDAVCNPSPWSAAQFESALDSRWDTIAVYETDGAINGFIVWQSVCGESELHLIATRPQQRGRGIASTLLSHWFQTASAQQLTRLFLEVRAGNDTAQRLYRRHGFTECGRRKNYYPLPQGGREDAVLMEKSC